MTQPADPIKAADALAAEFERRPSLRYKPGRAVDIWGKAVDPLDNGAMSFHCAPHIYRLMAPGNGHGKSTMAAVEVDWWGFGDHRFQRATIPKRSRTMIWCSQKFQQFEIQKPLIEKWWPNHVRNSWNENKHSYEWPDGTKLFVITSETDWSTIQGIEPDLVIIDEECDAALWRELQRRRRGLVRTRYCITATATHGLTWTYSDLYQPWKAWHEQHGCGDERSMMRMQGHRYADPALANVPGIWCWPRGSHADNPTATAESWALEQTKAAGSPVERDVKLYGGFRQFSGSPVFSPEGMERLMSGVRRAKVGHLVDGRFIEDGPMADGTMEVWEVPKPDKRYVMGVDFAYGIEGGDYDCAVVLDGAGEQVAQIRGHWGERFGGVLRQVLDWYGTCGVPVFMVGERTATGLPILRGLWDDAYWLYCEVDEASKGQNRRDKLGHRPGQQDVTVTMLRQAVSAEPCTVTVRSEVLHDEMSRFAFLPKHGRTDEAGTPDGALRWGCPSGFHDDSVRAMAMAVSALRWVPPYDPPPVKPPANSVAALWQAEFDEEQERKSSVWRR